MTDTNGPTRCSRCGTEYSGQSSPLGLCPACLMALGQESGIRTEQESGFRNQESAGISPEESGGIRQQEAGERSTAPVARAHAIRRRWLLIPGAALLLALLVFFGFMIRRTQDAAVATTASSVRFTLPYPEGTEPIDGAQF